MSVEVYEAVRRRQLGGPVRKSVMLALADRCGDDWTTFVGQERGAAETEIGVRTWRRTLAQFEAEGLISRERRFRSDGTRTSDRTRISSQALEGLPLVLPEQPAALAASAEQPPAAVAASDPDHRPLTPDNRPTTTTPPATDDRTTGRSGQVTVSRTLSRTVSEEPFRAARGDAKQEIELTSLLTGSRWAVRQPDGSVRYERRP